MPGTKDIWKNEKFVDSLYDYNNSGVNDKKRGDEEDAAIVIETDQVKPVSHTAADQPKLVSYTGSSNEEEEDIHVDVNFDETIDLAINEFSAFKIEFQRNK